MRFYVLQNNKTVIIKGTVYWEHQFRDSNAIGLLNAACCA